MKRTAELTFLRIVAWALVLGFGAVGSVSAQLSDADIAALQERAEEEGWTFEVGHNEATMYTMPELTGLDIPENWAELGEWDDIKVRGDLPSAFDWRDYNGVTPIRNQAGCGSCWAFSAVSAVESKLLIEEGWNLNLSEQWLVSCTGAGSCQGGWHTSALTYMRETTMYAKDPCGDSGAVLEADFPYVAWNAPCGCPYDHPYHIDGWSYVGAQWGVASVEQLKQAMYEHGPLSVCVAVDSAFQAYNGGIFNSCGATSINHAVNLVGWDDNLGSNGVWIMRNSWGPNWGEGGYMYIEYECARIGFAGVYARYTPPPPLGVSHAAGPVAIEINAILDDQTLNFAQSFDFEAVVSYGDDWTSCAITASVDGEFYHHPLGNFTPMTDFWSSHPALEFDSFFCGRYLSPPNFVVGPDVTPGSISALWFDLHYDGDGTYTIARFTVLSGTTLTLSGESSAKHTWSELHPFEFNLEVSIPTKCLGDLNNDGMRGHADLAMLLASYGVDDGGDINDDGVTDHLDLALLLSLWGVPCY